MLNEAPDRSAEALLHELQVRQVELEMQNETLRQSRYALEDSHISERKQIEQQLREAKDEAEKANNAKSRFLAAASHDLRQPLAALRLYADVLKRRVGTPEQDMVAGMDDCITNLSGRLTKLLDLNKLEAGVVKPSIADFSVFELLASLESVYSLKAQSKGLRLHCVPTCLTGSSDPILFKLIVSNFIDNALLYTESGGVVVGCRRRQGKIWIEVWDSGIGIAAAETMAIFEEFKQLGDEARNRGSGLGLAIVAKTAALLGLTISVRSWPGRGSVFAIELPVGQQTESPIREPFVAARRSLRIALVEDNPFVLQAMVAALQAFGHQVIAATNGGALQAELGTLPPDIVVSDHRLALGENGFDVITAVRKAQDADLPAIIITGDTDPKLMASMTKRGVVVLHKPLDMETLQVHIEKLTTPASFPAALTARHSTDANLHRKEVEVCVPSANITPGLSLHHSPPSRVQAKLGCPEMEVRLADFISRDMERIAEQWEDFARTQLPAAARMESLALRDHVREILEAIAKDLGTPQTRDAQAQKSMGLAPVLLSAPETAAQTHALLRVRSGFNIRQLAAEYRALRASVLRLWMDDCSPEAPHIDDIIRFNEAIDQALAESIDFFTAQVDQSRNLFLGMLGHDLRNPLQSVLMTASYLNALNNIGDDISAASKRLISSGTRMQALLDDLLDFDRVQLGLGIPVTPARVDLAKMCGDALDDIRAAYPGHQIDLRVTGDTKGCWDGRRLQQLLGNLVVNAIKYGNTDSPVQVKMTGDADEVRLEVRNAGEPIDPLTLDSIFEPLTRGVQDGSGEVGLGLGLYIASQIAKAHGGDIEAHSDSVETTFTVRLPRK